MRVACTVVIFVTDESVLTSSAVLVSIPCDIGIMRPKLHLWVFFLLWHYCSVKCDVSEEARRLISRWAPLVWLYSEEVFYPSSVDFYLDHMEVRDEDEVVVQGEPTPDTIVVGDATEHYHLNTFEDIECVHCYEDHFHGQPSDQVPAYAGVIEWGDECQTIDVRYSTFYPYDYAKDVCIGLEDAEEEECRGILKTFGNHISDWERTEIRFQNGKPTDIYLSSHGFGAFYAYNEAEQVFDFYYGEPLKAADEDEPRIPVSYPEKVFLVEDTHPEVFSANGSHGVWATEGKHTYFKLLFVHLDDFCDRGHAWRLWENMAFIDLTVDVQELHGTEFQWMDFRGKWGNIQKLACFPEFISGSCGLGSGVHGPSLNTAFPTPPPCGA